MKYRILKNNPPRCLLFPEPDPRLRDYLREPIKKRKQNGNKNRDNSSNSEHNQG